MQFRLWSRGDTLNDYRAMWLKHPASCSRPPAVWNNKQASSVGGELKGPRPPRRLPWSVLNAVQARVQASHWTISVSATLRRTDSRRRVENSSTFSSFNELSLPPQPLSFSCFPLSPWRQHPSHHCRGDRGQVPGGAGGGGWFGQAQARGPDGSIGGHGGGGAQPGAHAAVGEGARLALAVLLALRRPAALQAAPLQEVCEHLTFALHADLAAADKVVVVGDETMDILCHLEKKHISSPYSQIRCLLHRRKYARLFKVNSAFLFLFTFFLRVDEFVLSEPNGSASLSLFNP